MPRVYKYESPIYIESHLGINRFNDYQIYYESQNVERIRTEGYFGRVHAIALDTVNNRWLGSADPDWEGSVSDFEWKLTYYKLIKLEIFVDLYYW